MGKILLFFFVWGRIVGFRFCLPAVYSPKRRARDFAMSAAAVRLWSGAEGEAGAGAGQSGFPDSVVPGISVVDSGAETAAE